MKSYKDQLNDINAVFLFETDLGKLGKALRDLDELLKRKLLTDLRELARGLRLRLDSKICFLKYINGLDAENHFDAIKHFAGNLTVATDNGYKNTIVLITWFNSNISQLYAIVNSVIKQKPIFTSNSALGLDGQFCDKAIAEVNRSIELLDGYVCECPYPNLVLGNVKATVKDVLDDCCKVFSAAKSAWMAAKVSACIKDITNYRQNTYFPMPENDEGGKSNALVLSTPLTDDARLFAANMCIDNRKLQCLTADKLTDKSTDFVAMIFDYVAEQGNYIIVEGLETLSFELGDAVLLAAMKVGKKGAKTFLTDTSGQAQLYKRALELAQNYPTELSATDISLEYISLPIFEQVKQLFEDREMLDPSTISEKLKQMTFMGFYGLNKVVKAFVSNNQQWLNVGKHASAFNKQAVLNYLEKVPAAYLIIDKGWGDYSQYDKYSDEVNGEFDYDGVREIDLYNIKQIIECNESIFSKCGMLARYCTIGNDDQSVWKKITRETMLERVTMAVRLVFRVLRIDIFPMVEILDALDNPTAGGLCVDGGKVIQFKYDCALDLQWLYDAIVHECFHALQSKLTHGQWNQWYYANMGISRGRVGEWKQTREIYDGNTRSKVYKVHMYEADARAFEVDCDDGRNKAWGGMNFR